MKRIRCVPLLCSSALPPSRMVDVVVRRRCEPSLAEAGAGWAAPDPGQAERKWVPRLLALAADAVRAAIDRRAAPVAPSPADVAGVLAGLVGATALIDTVLAILSSERLQSILDESVRRIDGRTELARCELKLALIPFTNICSPVNFQARECWCGSWILDGARNCAFCNEPAQGGQSTTVWKKEYFGEVQLEPLVEEHPEFEQELETFGESGVRIPKGWDPHKYIVAVEDRQFSGEEL